MRHHRPFVILSPCRHDRNLVLALIIEIVISRQPRKPYPALIVEVITGEDRIPLFQQFRGAYWTVIYAGDKGQGSLVKKHGKV